MKACKSKCHVHNKKCKRPSNHIGQHTYECGCVGSSDFVIDKKGNDHWR